MRQARLFKHDHQKGWFLPDDTLHHFEHPDAGAKRILYGQLKFSGARPALHHIESFKGNDGSWYPVFHYKLEMDKPPKFTPAADIEKVEWFDLNRLPPLSEMAHHGWALGVLRRIAAPV